MSQNYRYNIHAERFTWTINLCLTTHKKNMNTSLFYFYISMNKIGVYVPWSGFFHMIINKISSEKVIVVFFLCYTP